MRLIISDRDVRANERDRVIRANGAQNGCCGCFSCWLKTPGTCALDDELKDMGRLLSDCEELVVVSRCVFGGYSPDVKKVFDRSIAYVSPFFERRMGNMHHRRRYFNDIEMSVFFYGECGEEEKLTAQQLVRANAINFSALVRDISFVDEDSLGEVML